MDDVADNLSGTAQRPEKVLVTESGIGPTLNMITFIVPSRVTGI
jgi:hypothetical protein